MENKFDYHDFKYQNIVKEEVKNSKIGINKLAEISGVNYNKIYAWAHSNKYIIPVSNIKKIDKFLIRNFSIKSKMLYKEYLIRLANSIIV